MVELDNNKIFEYDANAIDNLFIINPNPLNEISPNLPKLFPKELIPVEKCENSILSLIYCLKNKDYDNTKCKESQTNFYKCKQQRDSILFHKIKIWEVDHFKTLNSDEKESYVKELKDKKENLIVLYEDKNNNSLKRTKIDNDIIQLTWRLNYIHNFQKNNSKNLI